MTKGAMARALLLSIVLVLAAGLPRRHVQSTILVRHGDQYRAAKEYSRAIDVYQELAVLRPQWALPYLRLGQIYVAQGKWEEAQGEFTTAWELDRGEAEALVGLGEIAHHRGDLNAAVAWLRLATASDPRNTEARYQLGQVYLKLSRFDLAQQEFQSTLLCDRHHQGAHYYLGLLLADHDAPLAVEHLRLAGAGLDPEQSERAEGMLLLLQDIAGADESAYTAARLGHAYIKCEVPSLALTQLERAISLQPNNHTARAYLGYALFALGDLERAQDVLREVTHLAPKHPLGHYFLAVLHRSAGYLPTALWEFKTSLRLDPSNAAVYADIADTYQRMELYVIAGEWYRSAARTAPHEAGFSLLLAQFYVDVLPRPEEGLAAARQAVAVTPDDPVTQDLLGWANYLAGEPAQAQAPLERAIALDPDFARAYYHLGVVSARLGYQETARWAYERAIDLDSDGQYRDRAIAELGPSD
ncbi:MAG: hypothetical protein CEE40_03875 [Chloroflexi bacterium B3_Chlor]|nr:MAG: hypothetical protein CEE40_03875 [Chloroflexi bacterium B3_Chlor]